ncbi:MAG: hypothetical protein GY697_15410 [Desulfobacterales bacterium]|nr:hypothetical protein [Desulfobacterales bacterium]
MLNTTRTGFRMSRVPAILIIVTGLLFSPSIVNSDEEQLFTAFIQQFTTGRIDWDKGVIYGTGRAYLDQNSHSVPLAMRGAQLIAASNILKLAAGVNLDERRKLGELGDGNFVIHLKAFLRFAEHESRLVEAPSRPYYEVTRKAHLTGISGLNLQILRRMKSGVDGLRIPQTSAAPIEESTDAPWLVLDARDLPGLAKVQPALFPKIASTSGNTIYDIESINAAALRQRPMASYVESAEDFRHLQSLGLSSSSLARLADMFFSVSPAVAEEGRIRKKRRRFIVKKVADLQGLSNTNLIISQNDALALQAEDSASQILKNCRVIVIVSSPVGGVEGMAPQYLSVR